MDHAELTRRFPAMADIGPAEAAAFDGVLRTRVFSSGDELLTEGVPNEGVFFIQEGWVALSVRVGTAKVSLGRAGEGSIFGEVSFFDAGPASATLTATTSGMAALLTRRGFETLRTENPRAGALVHAALCRALAEHVRQATDRLSRLRAGTARSQESELVERDGGVLDALRALLGLSRN